MSRLCKDEKKLGPLSWGTGTKGYFSIKFGTGSDDVDEDKPTRNQLVFYMFNKIIQLKLPLMVKAKTRKVFPNWDEATVKRLGRNYYIEYASREYGFTIFEGHWTINYGTRRDYNEWTKEQQISGFIPWLEFTQISHIRYDINNKPEIDFCNNEQNCKSSYKWPKTKKNSKAFMFADFDGELIIAHTFIETRTWVRGIKSFRWLKYLTKPMKRTFLEIEFAKETGGRKGSWKGGTIGTSIDLKPNETHEVGFIRYCEQHGMKFLSEVDFIPFPNDEIENKNNECYQVNTNTKDSAPLKNV